MATDDIIRTMSNNLDYSTLIVVYIVLVCGPICRSVTTTCYGKDYKHVDGDTSCLSNTDFGTSLKAVRCWGIEAAVWAAEGAETTFADQLLQIL